MRRDTAAAALLGRDGGDSTRLLAIEHGLVLPSEQPRSVRVGALGGAFEHPDHGAATNVCGVSAVT